ncbi:MAG TPA: FxsA family protein [Actinophytocola sp.]|uniref:FxsA family protein n=1 Tax=Actinophytocola sp. TaxID=1872138 RepID=UPI002E01EBC9|nr:FxsA family protein [Actinophytocola sp.]
MPVLLLLLVATFVEITVLVLVGQAIGLLPTILLLILASVVGMWLLRREGARTLMSFQQSMRAGRVPHREMVDGMLIAAAGGLILLPGFVSDVLALALLFPPTRSLITRRVTGLAERRAQAAAHGGAFVVDSVVIDELDRRRP